MEGRKEGMGEGVLGVSAGCLLVSREIEGVFLYDGYIVGGWVRYHRWVNLGLGASIKINGIIILLSYA